MNGILQLPKDQRRQLAANAAQVEIDRMRNLGFGGGLDEKRRSTAYCEYGFPDKVDFGDLIRLYTRGGVAHGVVNKLIDKCWSTPPEIIEGDEQDKSREVTPWEEKLKPVLKGGKFWNWVKEADRRRLVGRYSALILQINDGGKWDQPVRAGKGMLQKMIPAWQSSIEPGDYDDDVSSPNYGNPKYWNYTAVNQKGTKLPAQKIHPDRVFILGDYSCNAIAFLEPCYNNFVSLEKVEGGAGESYLKNASRQLAVEFDPTVKFGDLAESYGVSVDELLETMNEQAVRLNTSMDAMIAMQGGKVSTLTSTVPDPTAPHNVNLASIAACVDMPVKIVVGNQTGERASTEDQKHFNSRCQGRRTSDLSFELHDLFERLMTFKLIDEVSEFTILWDDLTEATVKEKLENAKIMADTNSANMADGEPLYTQDEIREVAGYDAKETADAPLDDVDPDGENKDGRTSDPSAQ